MTASGVHHPTDQPGRHLDCQACSLVVVPHDSLAIEMNLHVYQKQMARIFQTDEAFVNLNRDGD